MMTNRWRNVLYTGVTNSLEKSVAAQEQGDTGVHAKIQLRLVDAFEIFEDTQQAIAREKQIKAWARAKKDALISMTNPDWIDLAADWDVADSAKGIPRRLRGSE